MLFDFNRAIANYQDRQLAAYINQISLEQEIECEHESHHDECLSVAKRIAPEFAFANGEDYYRIHGLDTEESCWHEWLLEEAGNLKAAMQYFIDTGHFFTRLNFIEENI